VLKYQLIPTSNRRRRSVLTMRTDDRLTERQNDNQQGTDRRRLTIMGR